MVTGMSIKELKEREKEQRREYIIDAAEKLFFSRGYDNVSMNDIAEAVEMNKATLYLYFANKESLFFSVILKGVRLMKAMFRGVDRQQADRASKRSGPSGKRSSQFSQMHPDHYRMFLYSASDRFDWDCCGEARSCHEHDAHRSPASCASASRKA